MEHLENQNHSNEEKAENMPHETVNANPDPSADDENIHARDGRRRQKKTNQSVRRKPRRLRGLTHLENRRRNCRKSKSRGSRYEFLSVCLLYAFS